jgi:hypothetical protein
MLGEQNLLQFLARTATQTSDTQTGKQFLLDCVADYCGHAPLTDDQTMILIRHLA